MNADPAAQQRLLELAEIDAELDRVAHRRRTLPELAEIDELGRGLQGRRDAVITAETVLGDLDRDSAKLEKEIDQVRAREDRDRALLDSGAISSGRQLGDLQHELATLQRRQSALEDDLLELMERRETADAELQRARAALADAEQRLTDAAGRQDVALAELDDIETGRGIDRAVVLAELPGDLLALYERIRAQRGIGAALLRHRRCGACRLELDRTALHRVREAAPEDVQRCDECGVILVRTAESGL